MPYVTVGPYSIAAYAYDGTNEIVQAAARAGFATVAAALKDRLGAAGSAGLAVARDLPLLEAVLPDDTAGYGAALATLFADYVDGILSDADSTAAPSPAPPAGYQFASRLAPMAADPSQGLADLATLGDSLAPPGSLGAANSQRAANWQALLQLVEGSATAALVILYAQTDFASAADADMAREQIYGLIVRQIEASAGNDPLVQAWRGVLTAAVNDLTIRGSRLPDVATYRAPSPMPALALAQLLYRDGREAPILVQRNAAPHPLFLPLAVEYLAA